MRTSQYLKPDSTHSITSHAGQTDVNIFEPKFHSASKSDSTTISGTIVTIHPWAPLGGGEHNTIGIARHISMHPTLNDKTAGWRVITFNLHSSGAVWGIASAHAYEVKQTVDVVNWVSQKYGNDQKIVLFGSSAGAPIAGTALDQVLKQQEKEHSDEEQNRNLVSAYIAVGYTFGHFASLGFGRHFSSVIGGTQSWFGSANASSSDAATLPPKLFIMGERDEFTSVHRLEHMASKMKENSKVVDVEIVSDVGHFELESSNYDPTVANIVMDWLDKVFEGQ